MTSISIAQARIAMRKRASKRLNHKAELQIGSQSHLKIILWRFGIAVVTVLTSNNRKVMSSISVTRGEKSSGNI